MSADTSDAEATIAAIGQAGVDVDALASELQAKGADSFDASFTKLLSSIDAKVASLRKI